jgi:hypothetical protein
MSGLQFNEKSQVGLCIRVEWISGDDPIKQLARPIPISGGVSQSSRCKFGYLAAAKLDSLVYMLSPIPRRGAWDPRFCSCSPNRVSLPRKEGRVSPRIVRFEACSAFTRVTACTLATSPYIVTRCSPEASTVSLPPQLLRLLPAGASRRVGLSPTGKRRLFTAHPASGHSVCDPRPTGASSIFVEAERSRNATGGSLAAVVLSGGFP